MSTKEKTKTLKEILEEAGIDSATKNAPKLVLWNDDVNSFEWVILNLMEVMLFYYEKAENTAWEVHIEGSSVLTSGSIED